MSLSETDLADLAAVSADVVRRHLVERHGMAAVEVVALSDSAVAALHLERHR